MFFNDFLHLFVVVTTKTGNCFFTNVISFNLLLIDGPHPFATPV